MCDLICEVINYYASSCAMGKIKNMCSNCNLESEKEKIEMYIKSFLHEFPFIQEIIYE